MPRPLAALLLCLTAAGVQTPTSAAETPLSGCPVPPLLPFPDLPPADPADPRIEVFSGRAEVDLDAGALFTEQIAIRHGDGVLITPSARYDRDSGELVLTEGLQYQDPQAAVGGREAHFRLQDKVLQVEDAQFELFAIPSRGEASSISIHYPRRLELRDVSYTTCAPGHDDWLLRAGSLRINGESGIATARNASLSFKGVPILYTPWISYPATNKRMSGFLLPNLGTSDTRGVEFQIPYYVNLAPNYDATLTPRFMSKRGLQLISEFRYLSHNHEGTIDAEYLPNDDETDKDRYLFGMQHQSLFGSGWRATLNAQTVSDTAYFEDLSGSVSAGNQTNLERVLDLEYLSDRVTVLARFQDFETLDESLGGTSKPYRLVPQVRLSAQQPGGPLGMEWHLDSELSVFDRSTDITGARLHLAPAITLPMGYRGLHIEPAAALTYTAYSLNDTAPGADDRPTRTAPVFSIDARSVFERGRPGSGWLQTLEPRLQYIYIPFREQSDLPVFDTIEPDFNMVQLFRTNRFLGHDRLADTSQVNLGVTSRVLEAANGRQLLTATLGQSRYFSDQNVVLPGGAANRNTRSDWLAELGANLSDRWKVNFGYQWDTDAGQAQRYNSRLQYRRDERRVVNLGYRYRRDQLEDMDISAAWPLAERWNAVARYNYSLLDHDALDRFIGIEYENCCWGLRLVYRRYLRDRYGESDTAIALQLVLKGLTNLGDPVDRLLERGILDYQPR